MTVWDNKQCRNFLSHPMRHLATVEVIEIVLLTKLLPSYQILYYYRLKPILLKPCLGSFTNDGIKRDRSKNKSKFHDVFGFIGPHHDYLNPPLIGNLLITKFTYAILNSTLAAAAASYRLSASDCNGPPAKAPLRATYKIARRTPSFWSAPTKTTFPIGV